jgi:nucleoside phosphorylase/tetratricopeptide (TPR) repeat protein
MDTKRFLPADTYTIGLIYVKPLEMTAITVMLDEEYESVPLAQGETNAYTLGRIGKHNVAIVGPARGEQGKVAMADVVGNIRWTFKNMTLGLLVGIGGGVPHLPKHDVRLGDVVIGAPELGPAVVQYDLGKETHTGFEVTRTLNKPPRLLLQVVNAVEDKYLRQGHGEESFFTTHLHRFGGLPRLRGRYQRPSAPDRLFEAKYRHEIGTQCIKHDEQFEIQRPERHPPDEIRMHYSTILSGDRVMKSEVSRDKISGQFHNALCFEMEAAGLMDVFPCLVVRGICDYADSHKNKDWQEYAAATAAAYARELLLTMAERVVQGLERRKGDVVPEPISHIPFDPSPGFVGRTSALERLRSDHLRIVAILGLGGVGKSRLAMEFAYQRRSECPQQSIFWIEATDQLTFEKDVRGIGMKLCIPGIEDDKADIKNLVKQRLSDPSTGRWLLILDNADDAALWGRQGDGSSKTATLVQYLPRTTHGSIVVTTRTRGVASFLAGKEVIELHRMSPDEGVEMFTGALENPDVAVDRVATLTLLEKLTYLPLAIVQAASYMNMTQRSVQTYLKLLDKPEGEVLKLLSENFGDLSRYPNAINPVATTWLISFYHLRKYHRVAATLFSSMVCLHEKSIPQSLLPETESELDTVNAIGILTGYSFVSRQTGSKDKPISEEMYDLYRLVQLAGRNWLRTDGSLTNWTKTTIERVAGLFPPRDHQYKGIRTVYIPHAQRLCDDHEIQDVPARYQLLEKMGLCFVADGKYDEAVTAHKAVVQWRENIVGAADIQTMKAYNNLGEALIKKGDWLTAEMYLEKAVEEKKKILTYEHPSTLTSMGNLASTYRYQGRWKEAEELEVRVVETSKRVLGVEHPSTLTSMANLASTYRNQGRWKEAEELFMRVVETRQRVLGVEHPSTLTSMSNLASTYWKQGRWKEAEELFVRVIKRMKRVLGVEHPWTLTSMANLASTYWNQGRWKEAEELEVRVIETRKRVLGAKHPDTLTSMANLANTLKAQSKDDEAQELMAFCLGEMANVFGHSHPNTQNVRSTLLVWGDIGSDIER